jgi:hypothetical protein
VRGEKAVSYRINTEIAGLTSTYKLNVSVRFIVTSRAKDKEKIGDDTVTDGAFNTGKQRTLPVVYTSVKLGL